MGTDWIIANSSIKSMDHGGEVRRPGRSDMERECSDATYGDAINVSVRYLPDPTAHRLSKDVQLIKPDDTIRSAAALMKKIDAGLLPVTENDKLVGMITDRDIAIRGVAEGKAPDAKVRDAMSRG